MKHLNRTLKYIVCGMGANASESIVMQAGIPNGDKRSETNISHTSDHYSSSEDQQLILMNCTEVKGI